MSRYVINFNCFWWGGQWNGQILVISLLCLQKYLSDSTRKWLIPKYLARSSKHQCHVIRWRGQMWWKHSPSSICVLLPVAFYITDIPLSKCSFIWCVISLSSAWKWCNVGISNSSAGYIRRAITMNWWRPQQLLSWRTQASHIRKRWTTWCYVVLWWQNLKPIIVFDGHWSIDFQ